MRKKILMVTSFYPPYHVGGACLHVYHLANELAKRGYSIHVLYSQAAYYVKRKTNPSLNSYPNHKNIHLHNLESFLGKAGPLFSFITGYPASRKIHDLFYKDYDLIHYHNISLIGPQILNFGTATKIYTAHDHWLMCAFNNYYTNGHICNVQDSPLICSLCLMRNKRPPQVWRFSQLLKKSLKNISLIISPSNYIKSFLVKNSITQQIVVLPNFIPDPPNRCKSIHEGEYFFYAGMLEETKGILNLLEAFIGTDKKLIIAGKGSLEKHVRKVANKYGNIKYVGFFNHQEIYSYFKNAQAYILSSLCPENSPLTILEAFAVGTPAIGSNIGGIPEIIGKVDKNLFFNPYDVHEIRETVMNFRKETYSTDHIKTIFNDNYSSDVYIDRYIHLINGSVHATKNSG